MGKGWGGSSSMALGLASPLPVDAFLILYGSTKLNSLLFWGRLKFAGPQDILLGEDTASVMHLVLFMCGSSGFPL